MAELVAGFIDGHRVLPRGGALIDVVNPFTAEAIATVPEADDSIVDQAVSSSRRAFAEWSGRSVQERGEILLRCADAVEAHGEDIARLVTAQMGMPIALARASQWHLPAELLRAAARAAAEVEWSSTVPGATLYRRASGVVAAISPWNMPTYQIVAKLAGALVAGCPVVIKPSVQTPLDALRLVEILYEAGLPAGVVNLVQGKGSRTGAALCSHPDIAHVSFTGSVEAGKTVATLAASTLARCTLELGGKSPAIILPDADLAQAVTGSLTAGFVNSGQACNATTRMLVHADQRAAAEELIRESAPRFVVGDPSDETTQLGPLSTRSHGESVLRYISGALSDGGRLISGSDRERASESPGLFIAPTVISGLPAHAAAVQEEIFGPVIVVQTYTDLEDAVRVAHDSPFGLSASVWGPQDSAVDIGSKLHVGQVKINGVRTRERPSVPFGGVGQSGYGRELGALGIEEFTDVSAVMA